MNISNKCQLETETAGFKKRNKNKKSSRNRTEKTLNEQILEAMHIDGVLLTRLLKQWSRKTRSTVCSFTVSPASPPASRPSITHLKKKGKWPGIFLNAFKRNTGFKQMSYKHKWHRVSEARDSLPRQERFLWTSRWRCNRWTWCRHCWTLLQCNSPTSSSRDTGCETQLLM